MKGFVVVPEVVSRSTVVVLVTESDVTPGSVDVAAAGKISVWMGVSEDDGVLSVQQKVVLVGESVVS